jgi:YidC/Oxa1 family membrane protein insertase
MLALANIFQPLISVFEAVLKFFHNSVGVPWGWSIVLLTVVIRALLLPLTLKQFHSMQRMQRLAPVIKEMQKKYKDDKQRQQQEMMKLYKEHQVNPFSSCLPLVAQLPVFISLFYMLRSSLRKDICLPIQTAFQQHYADLHHISLHAAASQTTPCGPHGGAGFLFVKDLTDKASGATLVVLIVLYVGTQLGSSLMMSSPTMDKTQRQIMLFLPLLFVLFVINFPAGVLVYWITTNGWTIGQQYFVKRRLGHMGPPLPAGASAGGGGPGPPSGSNGDTDSGGGLGALLRGRPKSDEKAKERATVAAGGRQRTSAPPPSPRKKKKRSGRRR